MDQHSAWRNGFVVVTNFANKKPSYVRSNCIMCVYEKTTFMDDKISFTHIDLGDQYYLEVTETPEQIFSQVRNIPVEMR